MILPVASAAQVRAYGRRLVRRHPRELARLLGLHAVAAVSALAAPRLLGNLVEGVQHGTSRWGVDRIALAIGGFVVLQSLLVRFAVVAAARLGERVLAELREEFVDRVLALPLSTVEEAGTGDLVSRAAHDVETLSDVVRSLLPDMLLAGVQLVLTLGALVLVSPVLVLPCLIAVPLQWCTSTWYLRRAPAAYRRVGEAIGRRTDGVAETIDGARTVEALQLGPQRIATTVADLRATVDSEYRALRLRTVWFPITEAGFVLPVLSTLLVGGWFALRGWVSAGQVTAAVLYVQLMIDPMNRLLAWADRVQSGMISFARVLGVSAIPDDRMPGTGRPGDEELVARDVRFAYVAGRDVLHGLDLRVRPGERLAVVGPSGAGKSTLGRLLAGVHGPRTGAVSLGGVPLIELPLDDLRGHVALITQEHHVFAGTLRENVSLARPAAADGALLAALATVDALDWVTGLPDGLDTPVGSGGVALSPAQAQQLALARLVLADPHTLVLDEATALLDPRAARHLERSLAGALRGRTVIAIAHRLFSAHDADRVAVVQDGRISELGSHAALMSAGGAYAALWSSWHGPG